jgi:hypothetical protein
MAYLSVKSAAAVALAASLAACVESGADSNVVILRNQALVDSCAGNADPSAPFYGSGTIDLTSQAGYIFSPLVQNFAEDIAGSSLRIAFMHGAKVDIHFSDDARDEALYPSDLTRFQIPLSGSIDPGGYVGLIFELVPDELIPMLVDGDILLVDVRIYGEIGGNSFESSTFRYPIEVCEGCLAYNLGACSTVPESYDPIVGNPCGLQDSPTECCQVDTSLVCPARGTGL